jgi:lysozyme
VRAVSARGRDAIVLHEGLRVAPYKDVAGYMTIGVGHLLTRDELSSGKIIWPGGKVRWRDGMTREQCYSLLEHDLDIAESAVERLAPGLPQHRFDALVSFVFNIGVGAFERSTLLKKIRSGDLSAVPAEMKRWDRAGGLRHAGLARRREAEAAMWAKGET